MINTPAANVYTDFNGLAKLKTQARKDSQQALHEVARQFESVFMTMMLKTMRSAKLADGILDSSQSEFFQEMYDQQLALHLSGDPGIGLADLIVRQLSPQQPAQAVNQQALQAYRKISPPLAAAAPLTKNKNTAAVKTAAQGPINSKEQFVKQLWPHARQAAQQLGVDTKALLAQAALETGWGTAVIKQPDGASSHNLFNIKADKSWQGARTVVNTLEYEQGVAHQQKAGFRAYHSYRESFQDYVRFIKQNERYGAALKQAHNAENYLRELQQAGYATDPDYAAKVIKILHAPVLADFQVAQQMAMR